MKRKRHYGYRTSKQETDMKTTLILMATVIAFTSSVVLAEDTKKKPNLSVEVKEISHYTRATFTCYDGEGVSFKDKVGLPAKIYRKKGEVFCKNRCSKVTNKCGINSSQITGFAGLYRNDLFRKLLYTCQGVKTIFTEFGNSCKTRAEWKKFAFKRCRKLVGKLPDALNGYEVSHKCKKRKTLENRLERRDAASSSLKK